MPSSGEKGWEQVTIIGLTAIENQQIMGGGILLIYGSCPHFQMWIQKLVSLATPGIYYCQTYLEWF